MSRDKKQQRLILAVSVTLSAGVFSIMPTVYGAPTGGEFVVGGGEGSVLTTEDNVTKVVGKAQNNVVSWTDFSVNADEKVQFDNGAKEKNYMNVVTGGAISNINGIIEGGKDVYIVNPNGVIFGQNAQVDVGSLYVSSRPIAETNYMNVTDTTDMKTVFATSPSAVSGDIVNMGNVQASSVFVEGNNITFTDVANVVNVDQEEAADVTLNASGNISLGGSVSALLATKDDTTGYKNTVGATGKVKYAATINTEDEWKQLPELGYDKDNTYTLTKNLDFSNDESYTPIGNEETNPFKGTLDGQFHTVSGIKVSNGTYGGLFGYADNATIKNVGVINANITADYAGGIVGKAANGTELLCVYNEGAEGADNYKIQGINGAGGIVGFSSSSKVDVAYNTGTVINEEYATRAGAIAGYFQNSEFSNLYNTRTDIGNGLLGRREDNSDTTTLAYAYTPTEKSVSTQGGAPQVEGTVFTTKNASFLSDDTKGKNLKDYDNDTLSLGSINNIGGKDKDGKYSVWRIYEGVSRPLLRAFLTANGEVTVNYNYKQGAGATISNGGADVTTKYNHKDIVLSDIEYKLNGTTFTPEAGIIVSPTDDTVDGNVEWYNGVVAKSAFYDTRGQHGYDLVGNNVTITQRAVSVTSDLTDKHITKEYDGTPDAKDAVASLFSGSNTAVDGIIDGDDTVTISPNDVTAYYLSSSTTTDDSAQVGTGKDVKITGSLTILNADGYYNYYFPDGSSASFGDDTILTGNTITQKSIYVTLKQKTGIDKTYDGTDKTIDNYVSNKNVLYDTTVDTKAYDYDSSGELVIGDTTHHAVTVGYDEAGTYASKNATTSPVTVSYGGLYISAVAGETLSNYKLVDKVTGETISIGGSDTKGTIYGTGTISKKSLDFTGFSWYEGTTEKAASKQYDNSPNYTEPVWSSDFEEGKEKTVRSAQMANDNLTFRVQEARFAINADDNTAANTSAKNVNDAHGVVYTITIDGTDAANYDLSKLEVGNKYIVVGEGNITPRTIKLGVADGKTADKIYDATSTVLDVTGAGTPKTSEDAGNPFKLSADSTAEKKFNNGTESYHLLAYTDDDYALLNDGAYIEYTGDYTVYKDNTYTPDSNVNYDSASGSVNPKTITYTATLQNHNGNYVFADTNNETTTTLTNGVGTINQRELNNLVFTHAKKTYDGGTDVKTGTFLLDVTQVPLQGEDTAADVFDYSKINGVYHSKTNPVMDAHVEESGADNSKTVTYSWNPNVDIINNHNYKLADGVTSGTGKGAITPFELTDINKLSLAKNHDITKTYDGKDNVANAKHDSQYYIGDLTYTIDNDHVIKLDYTVPVDSDTFKGAYYASADVAVDSNGNPQAQAVTYNLAVSNTGDYTIANTLKTDGYLQWTGLTGTITKKDLTASLSESYIKDGNNKVYDGKTVANNDGVVFDGWVSVAGRTKSVTANYDTKDAEDNKVVTYKITLGDDTDTFSKNNYNLLVKQPGDSEAVAGNTITGMGNISQAMLTIDFTGPATKEYDGNADYDLSATGAVKPAIHDADLKSNDDNVKDTVALLVSNAHFDKKDAGDRTITYTISLDPASADSKNYKIDTTQENIHQDTSGTITLDGAGKISTKGITAIIFDFADISKAYDEDNNVAYSHTDTNKFFGDELGSNPENMYINGISFGGVTLTPDEYSVTSAEYKATGTEGDAEAGTKKVVYTITLADSILNNYEFNLSGDSSVSINDGVLTKHTTGTINKKQLLVSVNNTPLADKLYNGSAALDSNVNQAGIITNVKGFLNENTHYDSTALNGRYAADGSYDADKNVAYQDAAGGKKEVAAKDVLLDIVLTDNANNYTITSADTDKAVTSGNILKVKGLGKITPRELTADFAYTERAYKGSKKTDAEVKGITLNGVQTGDSITLTGVTGEFGDFTYNTETQAYDFTPNGDVNPNEELTDKADYKGVRYSGLKAALANVQGEYGNYTIEDIKDYEATNDTNKNGKITRLKLTDSDLQTRFDAITKSYDGNPYVLNPNESFHIFTEKTGEHVDLDYKLAENGAVYKNGKDVSTGYVIYTLNGLEKKEFNNYDMSDVTMDFSATYDSSDSTYNPDDNKASITPRVLKIDMDNSGELTNYWVKTYDGSQVIKNADGTEKTEFAKTFVAGHDILTDDTDVELKVTGEYHNKKANMEPEESTATTDKIINYKLTLTDDKGNYTLDATGNTVVKVDETTYQGKGAIKKRTVYVGFKEGYGSEINKPYDGTPLADDNDNHKKNIEIKATTIPNTGIISGDDAVLNDDALAAIEANYESKNVARYPDGEVKEQVVKFTNIKLQGEDGDNYAVRAQDDGTDILKGSGKILPLTVTVTRDNAPTKTYNKAYDIDEDKGKFTVTPSAEVEGEEVKDFLTISGKYLDANVGQNKAYTYTLSLTDTPNYELVNSTSATQSVTVVPDTYGQQATLNGNNGVIDKRTISANFNGGYLTKVYDGEMDGTSELLTDKTNELYDATNNTDKPLTNVKFTLNDVANGDIVNLTGTATFDGQDAADPDNPDELKEYNVTYTLNLDNTNYQFKDDGSTSTNFAGKGYIARRGLVITTTPVSINAGEAMPQFTGTVTGFAKDEQSTYNDFVQAVKNGFKAADNASNTAPGTYGVYGWYMGSRTGMLDLNYTFEQSPANDSALTVNYVNTNNGNPDTKITPNNDIYKQISKDMNSGFGDNGAAAIEYKDKSGKVLGTEKIDSGEINGKGLMIGGGTDMSKEADRNANIGIAGGDIVNMEGANAAGSVNIETNGEGTVVNLEVFAIDGEKQNIIGEGVRDKKDEKEGEIAIKSSNGEDDEIELTVEKQGVNVA